MMNSTQNNASKQHQSLPRVNGQSRQQITLSLMRNSDGRRNMSELPSLCKINNRKEIENELRQTSLIRQISPKYRTPKIVGQKQLVVTEENDQYRYLLRHQQDIRRDGQTTGHMNTSFITSFRAHLNLKSPKYSKDRFEKVNHEFKKMINKSSLKSNLL